MDWRRKGEDVAGRVNQEVSRQADALTRQVATLVDRAASLAERLDGAQAELARRVLPQPKPKRRRTMTVVTLLAGAAAGFAAAYFFDPERGRARRAEVVRQLNSASLETRRTAQRGAVIASDKATAVKSKVAGKVDNPNPDDLTLLDRVESEVFADPSIPKGDINLMVVDGKAVIRGQVEQDQIGAIEAAVRRVVGVQDVENLLHTPGTPAPNKAASRAASGNGGPSA